MSEIEIRSRDSLAASPRPPTILTANLFEQRMHVNFGIWDLARDEFGEIFMSVGSGTMHK